MNPEFERALRDFARESAMENPNQKRLITAKRILMQSQSQKPILPEQTNLENGILSFINEKQEQLINDDSSIVSTTLSLKRKQRGISQNALAFKTGLNRSTISKIESGQHIPTLQVFGKIISILKLNPEDTYNLLVAASKLPEEEK